MAQGGGKVSQEDRRGGINKDGMENVWEDTQGTWKRGRQGRK